jgi:hypothetical protein
VKRRVLVASGALALLGVVLVATYFYVYGYFPAAGASGTESGFSYVPFGEALRYVQPNGMVDYAGLSGDRSGLDRFVASLSATSPLNRPELFPTREDELAYWINAYNALVLQAVADRYPDLQSARDLTAGRFFWSLSWPIGGKRLTLWAIEHRFLREQLGDARIHFAINCGATSCPALEPTPYMPDTVDAQLNDSGRRFMGEKRNVRIEGNVVHLSQLFQWYAGDFTAALPPDRKGGVLQLVWAFLPDSCDERPGCDTRSDLDRACGVKFDQCTVVYDDYDWSLNDRSLRPKR